MNRIHAALALACLLALSPCVLHAEPEARPFDAAMAAAEKGDAQAQYALGLMYHDGEGVPKDMEKAFSWIERSALQGHAPAQLMLGVMYEHVRLDSGKAFEFYGKAARQGNTEAQYLVGSSYERGFGIGKDAAEAGKWYGRACSNGDAAACDALARMKGSR